MFDSNADPYFDGTWRSDGPGRALPFVRAMNVPEGRGVFAGGDQAEYLWQNFMEGAIAYLFASHDLAVVRQTTERAIVKAPKHTYTRLLLESAPTAGWNPTGARLP